MRIIGYTYNADNHCPTCALEAAGRGRVDYLYPILDIDETSASLPLAEGGCDLACGTCHTIITPHYDKENN